MAKVKLNMAWGGHARHAVIDLPDDEALDLCAGGIAAALPAKSAPKPPPTPPVDTTPVADVADAEIDAELVEDDGPTGDEIEPLPDVEFPEPTTSGGDDAWPAAEPDGDNAWPAADIDGEDTPEF